MAKGQPIVLHKSGVTIPGTPARAKALQNHVRNLTSGNARRQQAAQQHLTKMNLTPQEHMYVHSQVHQHQLHQQGLYRSSVSPQVKAARQQIKSDLAKPYHDTIGNNLKAGAEHLGHLVGESFHTSPLLGDLGNKGQARQAEHLQHSLGQDLYDFTGIPAILNVAHNPAGAGMAAAGFLPFGKFAELGKIADVAKGAAEGARIGRTEEQAAQHVAEATAEARSMGHGDIARAPHEPPRVPKGETSASTGGELGKQVRGALAGRVDTKGMGRYEAIGAKTGIQSANKARVAQEALYSAERAKRAGMAAEAMKVGGQEGYHAALKTLKGQLPKVDFQGFKHLDQKTLDAMHTFIQQHEGVRTYEKVRAMGALQKAVSGRVPTASEQKILQRIFGADTTKQVVDSVGFWKKAGYHARDILNVPRAIMASFDLSAPFRQGLVAGVSHPGIFFKNFAPMLKSFKSEDVFHGVMSGIYDRPTFPLMQKAKLALTDIGDVPGGGAEALKEEQFNSNLAERLPGIGHGVRASDRAYVAFLNKTRADMFDRLVHQAAESGVDLHNQKELGDIAKFINSATGRGSLGALQKHAVTLNTLLFSPRLLASRFNFLNPVYYMSLSPFARKQALRAAVRLVGTMGTVLYAAKMAGAQVSTDPTNADFAKIKIGNTRIDLAGGFQQPVRLLAQLAEGKITSSITGKVIHLGPQGVGHLSRKDIAQRFFEGKLSPVPSLVNDLFAGTTFAGQPLSWKTEMASRMLPLVWQDMYGIGFNGPPWNPKVAKGHGNGPGLAALLAIPDMLGIGVQNYSAKKKGSSSSGGSTGDPYGGSSSSGGNPYGGSSSSSGSPYG